MISLKGISKKYLSGVYAIDHLDLDIHKGEFLSIVGPSGCGKSTLLRILAGLITPTSGTFRKEKPLEKENGLVGYVFQDATLMPWATVFDNVWLPLRLSGVSRKCARPQIMALLTQLSLDSFAMAYPRELSGGMKMKTSIARALITSPNLLLMDEPFAALDEITRFSLNDELLRLQEHGNWTVVFVTHSIYEAAYLSDRIAIMSARPGRLMDVISIQSTHKQRSAEFRTSSLYYETCRNLQYALQRDTSLRSNQEVSKCT